MPVSALRNRLRTLLLRSQVARAEARVAALPQARPGDPLRPDDALLKDLGIGRGSYEGIGREFVGHLRTLCGLRPDHRVLDIGCGLGRMAAALTAYLGPDGSYRGFDISPAAVGWCAKRITPHFPRFLFDHVDVYNPAYNARGRLPPDELAFPYPDDSFDCALAASVFTHLIPPGMRRYLEEARRVLRPGGKGLFTFFLLDDVHRAHMARGRAMLRFVHALDGYCTTDRHLPELAVAYDEAVVRRLFAVAGLTIEEPIRYGAWSGRPDACSGQDIVIAAG